jgi:predicted nucleotidyltransferase
MHLREELEAILDRKVDFVSKTAIQNSRNWLRRKEILESGMIIYEKRSAIIA